MQAWSRQSYVSSKRKNRKFKQIVADLSLDKHAAGGDRKKALGPSQRRVLLSELRQRFGCSLRNALCVVRISSSTYLYKPVKKDESVLKMRIKEITDTRVHYGST